MNSIFEINAPVLGLWGPDMAGIGYDNIRSMVSAAAAVETGFPKFGDGEAQLREALADTDKPVILSFPLRPGLDAGGYLAAMKGKLAALGLKRVQCCTLGPLRLRLLDNLDLSAVSDFVKAAAAEGLAKEWGVQVEDRVELMEKAAALSPLISYVRFDYSPLDIVDRPGAYGFDVARRLGLRIMAGGSALMKLQAMSIDAAALECHFPGLDCDGFTEKLLDWFGRSGGEKLSVLSPQTADEFDRWSAVLERCGAKPLGVMEQLARNSLRDAVYDSRPAECTACGCCMPCPMGVDLPGIMVLYNDALTYNAAARSAALRLLLSHDTDKCSDCGKCVKNCPRRHPVCTAVHAVETMSLQENKALQI